MSFARLRLVIAAVLFLGWIGWLAYAVSRKGTVQIVSQAQLIAADCLVIADVQIGADGQPQTQVTVKQVLRPLQGGPQGAIEVRNLTSSATPLPMQGDSRTPIAGEYLLPLVRTENGYRIAGLPRSPGFDGANLERPLIYPWTPDVQTQVK